MTDSTIEITIPAACDSHRVHLVPDRFLEDPSAIPSEIPPTAMEESVLHTSQESQRLDEETMIVQYQALIYHVIKSLSKPDYLPYEDLIAEGNLALLYALRCYRPNQGVPFRLYARKVIRNQLMEMISKESGHIQKLAVPFPAENDAESPYDRADATASEFSETVLLSIDVERALAEMEKKYEKRPSVLQGIRALVLHAQGYRISDLAKAWGMNEHHLNVNISRAKKCLRKEAYIRNLAS